MVPLKPLNIVMRKTCEHCKKNPAAINYKYRDRVYYRKSCERCIKKQKQQKQSHIQLLKKSGYKKKTQCDRCGFRSKTNKQIEIYYLDKNKHNVSFANLRSFCINCIIELENNPNSREDVIADY